jgi:hypothetical protein
MEGSVVVSALLESEQQIVAGGGRRRKGGTPGSSYTTTPGGGGVGVESLAACCYRIKKWNRETAADGRLMLAPDCLLESPACPRASDSDSWSRRVPGVGIASGASMSGCRANKQACVLSRNGTFICPPETRNTQYVSSDGESPVSSNSPFPSYSVAFISTSLRGASSGDEAGAAVNRCPGMF